VVLAYLSRHTHRVAISNRRLIAADVKTVAFKVKAGAHIGRDTSGRGTYVVPRASNARLL